MALFLHSPFLGFSFLILLLVLFRINDNKYGRAIGYKYCQKLIKNNPDNLYIIDIRSKESFNEARVVNSNHVDDAEALTELIAKHKKILIIHDSEIELSKFYIDSGAKTFNDSIYQLDFISCNLAQYDCTPVDSIPKALNA